MTRAGKYAAERNDDMRKLLIKDVPALSYATEEAINRLRVNLNFLGNDIRKIMIISSSENEGKSFVAMHLWRQMAESGTHSILVDADLRKSVMAEKYQMEPADGGEIRGTSHVLADAVPLEKAVFHTEIEQGDILPNTENVVNPTMLLEGKHFQDMLEEMAKEYRYVFLDTPPLDLVSDGEKIGSMCDGAILVVRSGFTSRNLVRNSIQLLERAGCPLLGIVLNRAGEGKKDYYYGKKEG